MAFDIAWDVVAALSDTILNERCVHASRRDAAGGRIEIYLAIHPKRTEPDAGEVHAREPESGTGRNAERHSRPITSCDFHPFAESVRRVL